MREYCAEASNYGNVTHPASQRFAKILVILNPMANKRSSTETVSPISNERQVDTGIEINFVCAFLQYDDYCAPILHLGGLAIEVIKTDSEGHARRYVEDLETLPEAILCAGGDGTLSEVVTGENV